MKPKTRRILISILALVVVLVALLIAPAAVGGDPEVGWLPPPDPKPTMQTVHVYIPVEVGGITELRNWLDEFHGGPNHEIIANGFEENGRATVGNFMISVGSRGTWAYIVVTPSPEGGEYTIVHYGDGFESAPWPSTGA